MIAIEVTAAYTRKTNRKRILIELNTLWQKCSIPAQALRALWTPSSLAAPMTIAIKIGARDKKAISNICEAIVSSPLYINFVVQLLCKLAHISEVTQVAHFSTIAKLMTKRPWLQS